MEIPRTGNVEKRIEIPAGRNVNVPAFFQQANEARRNVETAHPIQKRKGGIRNEPRKLRLEIVYEEAEFLNERVESRIVIAKKRNDEKRSEGAEGIIEFLLQNDLGTGSAYLTVLRNSLNAAVVKLAPEIVSIWSHFTGFPYAALAIPSAKAAVGPLAFSTVTDFTIPFSRTIFPFSVAGYPLAS